MKKILFLTVLLIGVNVNTQSQGLSFGINAGVTTGNINNTHSVAFGFDVNYLYEITEQIEIGAATGYIFFYGKDVNGTKSVSKSYIPIAATVRFNNDSSRFFVGGDFGYAIGISSSGDRGGIYFKPMLGYNISESIELNLFYTGIKKEQPTYSYVGLGLMMRI